MRSRKLPPGFRIDWSYCYYQGTGYGDDGYGPALLEWREVKVRRFLRRSITVEQWVMIDYLPWVRGNDVENTFWTLAWAIVDGRQAARA